MWRKPGSFLVYLYPLCRSCQDWIPGFWMQGCENMWTWPTAKRKTFLREARPWNCWARHILPRLELLPTHCTWASSGQVRRNEWTNERMNEHLSHDSLYCSIILWSKEEKTTRITFSSDNSEITCQGASGWQTEDVLLLFDTAFSTFLCWDPLMVCTPPQGDCTAASQL